MLQYETKHINWPSTRQSLKNSPFPVLNLGLNIVNSVRRLGLKSVFPGTQSMSSQRYAFRGKSTENNWGTLRGLRRRTSEPGEKWINVQLLGWKASCWRAARWVELRKHTGAINDIHKISSGPLVSLSCFRLRIYHLNSWHSTPIYHLSLKPERPPTHWHDPLKKKKKIVSKDDADDAEAIKSTLAFQLKMLTLIPIRHLRHHHPRWTRTSLRDSVLEKPTRKISLVLGGTASSMKCLRPLIPLTMGSRIRTC